MELKISITGLLILLVLSTEKVESKEITHQDIKDAMLSLVHIMRENTDKLERHEARDRQTAEQLKRAMSLLTKRMSTVDDLNAYLVKLKERLTGIEQLIHQKDERERIQLQKTADTLEDLENRLEGWAMEIETKIIKSMSQTTSSPPIDRTSEIFNAIADTEKKLTDKIQKLEMDVDSGFKVAEKAWDNFSVVPTEMRDVGEGIRKISEVLNKLEAVNPTDETPSEQSSQTIEEQTRILKNVQTLLQTTFEHIQDLPRVTELKTMHNETQMSLQETKHVLKDAIVVGNAEIESRISENKEEARDKITELRSAVMNNAERINQELRDLGKGQSVMVEMANQVMDTKKRLEHAHKILREFCELVMKQGLNINNTLNSRFDGISNDIMDNQNGALANLTVKMEQEINQVWRQINVMYQQMMKSAKALDKLHKQNEAYVNGTTSTMDDMESKVGEITKRINEVDSNLNYLLGRLSLVAHEFNQIKSGLGTVLDNIKASFTEVQEKANDLSNGPGPHPVPQNYKELDANAETATNTSPLNIPSSRR